MEEEKWREKGGRKMEGEKWKKDGGKENAGRKMGGKEMDLLREW